MISYKKSSHHHLIKKAFYSKARFYQKNHKNLIYLNDFDTQLWRQLKYFSKKAAIPQIILIHKLEKLLSVNKTESNYKLDYQLPAIEELHTPSASFSTRFFRYLHCSYYTGVIIISYSKLEILQLIRVWAISDLDTQSSLLFSMQRSE